MQFLLHYGMAHGYGMGYYGTDYGMGIFGLIFTILVIIGLCLVIRYLWINFGTKRFEHESAIEILNKRYARGDINREEFEVKKKDMMQGD